MHRLYPLHGHRPRHQRRLPYRSHTVRRPGLDIDRSVRAALVGARHEAAQIVTINVVYYPGESIVQLFFIAIKEVVAGLKEVLAGLKEVVAAVRSNLSDN